jgi:hypothetical protein
MQQTARSAAAHIQIQDCLAMTDASRSAGCAAATPGGVVNETLASFNLSSLPAGSGSSGSGIGSLGLNPASINLQGCNATIDSIPLVRVFDAPRKRAFTSAIAEAENQRLMGSINQVSGIQSIISDQVKWP